MFIGRQKENIGIYLTEVVGGKFLSPDLFAAYLAEKVSVNCLQYNKWPIVLQLISPSVFTFCTFWQSYKLQYKSIRRSCILYKVSKIRMQTGML